MSLSCTVSEIQRDIVRRSTCPLLYVILQYILFGLPSAIKHISEVSPVLVFWSLALLLWSLHTLNSSALITQ